MDVSKCEICDEYCHMGKSWHEAAIGRMEAMKELAKCAEYWEALFDDNDKSKITPERLNELVEADLDGRCVVLPCKVGTTIWVIGPECGKYFVRKAKFSMAQFDHIGETVFFDRKSAEAAMKGEQNG